MPAIEALIDQFRASHTQVLGISVDSVHCHFNWAARDLGGIAFPLLADFHPKGVVAASYGLYLEAAGITDRATVVIDHTGIVRYAHSVTPSGKRDANELLRICAQVSEEAGPPPNPLARQEPPGKMTLFFHQQCGFSRRVLRMIDCLRIADRVELRNVREETKHLEVLVALTGRETVPCLVVDGQPMHESGAINEFLGRTFGR